MVQLDLIRTGARRGVATNDRGAQVRYGPVEDAESFTPGELLAIALAACNMMSIDHVLRRRVGDPDAADGEDLDLRASVSAVKDTDENRYTSAEVRIAVGQGRLDGLDEQAQQELRDVLERAIDRGCTVGRTLHTGLPHTAALAARESAGS